MPIGRKDNISLIDQFIKDNTTGGTVYCVDLENSLHIFTIGVLAMLLLCIFYIIHMKYKMYKVPKSIVPVAIRLK